MRKDRLSRLFSGIAVKRLSAVETAPHRSNQHEFNGTQSLKGLLGNDRLEHIPTRFIYLGAENEGTADEGFLTWYDARECHPARSEWRLYFPSNDVMSLAKEGDILLLARRPNGELIAVISPTDTGMSASLLELFGAREILSNKFLFNDISISEREIDFTSRLILDELGIESEEPQDEKIDEIVEQITSEDRDKFFIPSTRTISELARKNANTIDPREDPDAALLEWLEFEETLFRRLERIFVGARIEAGFIRNGEPDVDAFVKTALSVLNRRKARMGLSLENHTEEILQKWKLHYERNAKTEGNSRPDFLFPSSKEYHDPEFDKSLLTMLGVKSTLKDRWRQVLAEAKRIDKKHLLTLQATISNNQIDEMNRNNLKIVIPKPIQKRPPDMESCKFMTLKNFLEMVSDRQKKIQDL